MTLNDECHPKFCRTIIEFMYETSKAFGYRIQNGDFEKYLHGDGIDIGSGDDPLKLPNGASVKTWDRNDGDAKTLVGISDESMDFVYSSHCLEHINDIDEALHNWSRVCKAGGAVYIVVPEWTLYEHRHWPSPHNGDHKASFALISCDPPRGHNHFTIRDLIELATNARLSLVDLRLDLEGFTFALHRLTDPLIDQTLHGAQAQITAIFRKIS